MTYKQVNVLDPIEAAYLAGLMDGGGTVTLSRRNRYKQRGLMVMISNTEKPLLDNVLKKVGVGKITKKTIAQSHHTPSFTYQVSNRQALALLQQIAPFLRSHKAARACLVLDEYVRLTPRNGRYTTAVLSERAAFVKKFFDIKPGMGISSRLVLDSESPQPTSPPAVTSQG